MRKILSVIKREYIQIVRTKGFIIGTVLGPILMVALIGVPLLVTLISVDKQETMAVVDKSGEIFDALVQKLDVKMSGGEPRYRLEQYRTTGDPETIKQELNRRVMDKELTAYLILSADIIEGGVAEYYAENVSAFDEIRIIQDAVSGVVIEKRLSREGLDPARVSASIRSVPLRTNKVTKRGAEEDMGGTFIFAYLLVFILYMTLFFYGSLIMRGVIEEKTSRVVEVVLSSLRPFQLMMGKILGIAAVGFTQYTVWAVFGLATSHFGPRLMGGLLPGTAGFKLPSIPASVFFYFVLFFILGYFLYGTLYAAIGAMVNTEKEAQQLMFPVSMLLIVPILLIMYVVRSPDSGFSVFLSLVPFFAPILMLLRICVLTPPFIQVALSILLMLLTILLMVWLASKIYRVGILMYGKRPGFREIFRWIHYS
ncbi:MAG: ABC transporter permease [Candidatus Aminicenantes bacterium]|nr:ABC transporter permease [Candidatus Aminicenantes bacterium]